MRGRHLVTRRALVAPLAAVLLLAIPDPAGASSWRDRGETGYVIEGEQVFPEGVAADRRYVYATSKADGTVYRGRARESVLRPFLPAGQDGRTTATGIKSTGSRLVVAGAETGRTYVYDARDGALVAVYTVPDPEQPTFVNDAVVARNGDVYVTDSLRPVIYRIPAAEVQAPATGTMRTLQPAIALPADSYGEGFNANGIVATRDGDALLVVYSNSGALYRVDLATGATRQVDLDRPLVNGDGLELRGRTLYAARNFDNLVSTVRLSRDQTRGLTVDERTYPGADTPTTLALRRGELLVVNSQFDTFFGGAPQTSPTFTISTVPLR